MSPRAAEQVEPSSLRRRARAQRVDQLDAGDALADRRPAHPRGPAQRRPYRKRERRAVDDVAKRGIALTRRRPSRYRSVTTRLGCVPFASATMRPTACVRRPRRRGRPRTDVDDAGARIRRRQRRVRDTARAARPASSRACSGITPSGERQSPTAKPNSRIAHLTGIGLVVANSAPNERRRARRWICAARATSPARYASAIARSSRPQTWAATLTIPSPPIASDGKNR